MKALAISSKMKDYVTSFEQNLDFLSQYNELEHKAFVIDQNVYNLYKDKFLQQIPSLENSLYLLNAIEENKTLDECCKIYSFLIEQTGKKNLTLISIGGGITQDITGFVASTLYRGIKWVYLPTTFLAQTDSCIGSKTSLNFKQYKNLLGSFYPPNSIHILSSFVETLTRKDFYSGIGETIKLQLMRKNQGVVSSVDNIIETISRCVLDQETLLVTIQKNLEIKLSYMEGDEFDQGTRMLLNYGHCFGHAVETTSDYEVPHGIAVTIGMFFANIVSKNRKLLAQELCNKVNMKLLRPNIAMELKSSYFPKQQLLTCLKNDKKRIGKDLTIVIPDSEFKLIKINDFTEVEFEKCFIETLEQILP